MNLWSRNLAERHNNCEIIEDDYLDALKIESVMKLGEKVLVIINGQSFREGETVNNILIESIESKKITFRMGNKRVIKDVGS